MAKDTVAPPIDRPLGRAYLRKFTGWSTAYPPGMSEPTSLRVMHNCSVTADGALRIRPGLRRVLDVPADGDIVGTFEHFYLKREDGTAYKALLFAVRESDDSVGFRVASDPNNTGHMQVQKLTEVFEYASYDRPSLYFTKEQLLANWDRFIAEKGIRAEDYVNPFWRPRGLPEHTLPAAKRQPVDAEWRGDEQVVGRNWKKHHGAEQAV